MDFSKENKEYSTCLWILSNQSKSYESWFCTQAFLDMLRLFPGTSSDLPWGDDAAIFPTLLLVHNVLWGETLGLRSKTLLVIIPT